MNDWLIPQWPAPVNVRAVFTTRSGGVSRAPYDSLNLGDHVGDEPTDVALNRARLAQAIDAQPVFLKQVHGCEVLHVKGAINQNQAADRSEEHTS